MKNNNDEGSRGEDDNPEEQQNLQQINKYKAATEGEEDVSR